MLNTATRHTLKCGHFLITGPNVTLMSTDPLGRGRPHKGARAQRTVRVSRELNERIESDAAAAGLTMSDFLANIVHTHYGLPPVAEPQPQTYLYESEEFELKRAS